MDSTELWRVVNFEMLHSLLVTGVGWGIVPLTRVAEDLAAGRLVALQIERWAPRKNALMIPLVVIHATPSTARSGWTMAVPEIRGSRRTGSQYLSPSLNFVAQFAREIGGAPEVLFRRYNIGPPR